MVQLGTGYYIMFAYILLMFANYSLRADRGVVRKGGQLSFLSSAIVIKNRLTQYISDYSFSTSGDRLLL